MWEEALDVACRAADIARSITLSGYGKELPVVMKSDNSPVTHIDQEVEMALRNTISQRFPDHSIVGEEYMHKNTPSSFCWYIDPIDGTVALLNQIPTFATLIALYNANEPLIAV